MKQNRDFAEMLRIIHGTTIPRNCAFCKKEKEEVSVPLSRIGAMPCGFFGCDIEHFIATEVDFWADVAEDLEIW